MALKVRGSKIYYYQTVWSGGRARTAYAGSGEDAVLAAELDRVGREERERARERAERDARAFDDAWSAVGRWSRLVEAVVAAALESAGYHRHDRGPWRKRRMMIPADNLPEVPAAAEAADAELEPLVKRAREGDRDAAKELTRILADDPDRLIRLGRGDLDRFVEEVWVFTSFKDRLRQAAVRARMKELRAELAGPDPSPLEVLLVDRVVLCWLQSQILEACAGAPGGFTKEYLARRAEQAHRKYLASIRALASVRKLLTPRVVQINLAGQQINVATDRGKNVKKKKKI
jgi:hypothetical protein